MKKIALAAGLLVATVFAARAALDGVTPPTDFSNYGGTVGGYSSLSLGVTAAGTSLGTATPINSAVTEVANVGSGTGVVLGAYSGSGGNLRRQEVINAGANALAVYPPASAAAIRNLNGSTSASANGAAVSLAVGTHATFECVSATLCYEAP